MPAVGTTTRSVWRTSAREIVGSSATGTKFRVLRPSMVAVRTRKRGSVGFPISIPQSEPAHAKISSGAIEVEGRPPSSRTTVTSIMSESPPKNGDSATVGAWASSSTLSP